MKVKACFCSL